VQCARIAAAASESRQRCFASARKFRWIGPSRATNCATVFPGLRSMAREKFEGFVKRGTKSRNRKMVRPSWFSSFSRRCFSPIYSVSFCSTLSLCLDQQPCRNSRYSCIPFANRWGMKCGTTRLNREASVECVLSDFTDPERVENQNGARIQSDIQSSKRAVILMTNESGSLSRKPTQLVSRCNREHHWSNFRQSSRKRTNNEGKNPNRTKIRSEKQAKGLQRRKRKKSEN